MKNLKAMTLALLSSAVLLSGCGNTALPTESDTLQVVVTNFAAYDFARGVAGDLADISILLPPGTDAHSYEPSPADIISIDQSDMFIYLGGESDTWVDTVLNSTSNDVNAVRMMGAQIVLLAEDAHDHDHGEDGTCTDVDCDHDHDDEDDHDHDHEDVCTDVDCDHDHEDEDDHDHEEEAVCTDVDCDHDHEDEDDHDHEDVCTDTDCDHDHDDEDDHDHEEVSIVSSTITNLGAVNSYDEHIWTSPSNAAAVVLFLADHFAEIDPDNADAYHANGAAYADEITTMGDQFASFFETVDEKLMVVGDRFPLKYFAAEYGIEYYAAFPGCSSETEPSAATMAYLIDLVNDRAASTVYYIEFSNGLVADAIAEATGAQTALFHSCENFTQEEIDSGMTYVDLMYQNLETLQNSMA